jgi:hypothetical protein
MKTKRPIETLILTVRRQRVILSPDLADVYGVETRVLHQAVKRNPNRFPGDFVFPLNKEEFSALKEAEMVSADGRAAIRSQVVILKGDNMRNTCHWPLRNMAQLWRRRS